MLYFSVLEEKCNSAENVLFKVLQWIFKDFPVANPHF